MNFLKTKYNRFCSVRFIKYTNNTHLAHKTHLGARPFVCVVGRYFVCVPNLVDGPLLAVFYVYILHELGDPGRLGGCAAPLYSPGMVALEAVIDRLNGF